MIIPMRSKLGIKIFEHCTHPSLNIETLVAHFSRIIVINLTAFLSDRHVWNNFRTINCIRTFFSEAFRCFRISPMEGAL
jgi:hypothetical protein